MKIKLILVLVLVFALSSVASASIITGVDRSNGRGSDGGADPLASDPGGLADGVMVYSDRTYPYINTPSGLLGYEYVRMYNDDKNTGELDVSYLVTIGEDAPLWMAVDDRLGDEDGDGVIDNDLLLAWIELATYRFTSDVEWVNTDLNLYIREKPDGSTDRPMSVFMTTEALAAGTYDFGLNPTNKNFYIVGAVPEPMTIALLGLGGLGLIRRKRS